MYDTLSVVYVPWVSALTDGNGFTILLSTGDYIVNWQLFMDQMNRPSSLIWCRRSNSRSSSSKSNSRLNGRSNSRSNSRSSSRSSSRSNSSSNSRSNYRGNRRINGRSISRNSGSRSKRNIKSNRRSDCKSSWWAVGENCLVTSEFVGR